MNATPEDTAREAIQRADEWFARVRAAAPIARAVLAHGLIGADINTLLDTFDGHQEARLEKAIEAIRAAGLNENDHLWEAWNAHTDSAIQVGMAIGLVLRGEQS